MKFPCTCCGSTESHSKVADVESELINLKPVGVKPGSPSPVLPSTDWGETFDVPTSFTARTWNFFFPLWKACDIISQNFWEFEVWVKCRTIATGMEGCVIFVYLHFIRSKGFLSRKFNCVSVTVWIVYNFFLPFTVCTRLNKKCLQKHL